jgi:hypothetical protein
VSVSQPYDEVSALAIDPEFVPQVDGQTVRWTCPQCKHNCVHRVVEGVLFGLAPELDGDYVVIECTCGERHEGATADAIGCGCYFGWRV